MTDHISLEYPDDFLIGTATEIFMLKNAASYIPTEIVTKGKFHFIGKILQLVEVIANVHINCFVLVLFHAEVKHYLTIVSVIKLGFRADGIKELFRQNIQVFNGHLSYADFEAIFKVVSS